MATISEALAIALQHYQAGRLQAAEQIYRQILAVEPNNVDAIHVLGVITAQVGKHEVAVEYIRRAIRLKGNVAAFHSNLGNALKDQGNLDEAVACYRRALELEPDYAEAHNNLGNALREQGKLDESLACCRRALELKPDFAEAHNNLGNALREQGKLEEAVACYHRALELDPDYADAHWNRSLTSLLEGDFEHGWMEYEWRLQRKGSPPGRFQQPIWDGGHLDGRTILLRAEQGLGDTIQFIRYAPLLRQCQARVVVECQKPLVRLVAGCRGIDQLIGEGDELPEFDVHAPLMSLPLLCKTTLENVPASVPYILAAPALVMQWRDRLSKIDGLKIGICWQGNPRYPGDRFRSIPLRRFAKLAQMPGVCLISLQKGVGREQLAEVRDDFPVVDLADELDEKAGPFMDTAAIMRNLDLVIASDTATAHLAGAIGVPVWVALPLAPDWRWLLGRSDSPWYPTMRLFRQRSLGDWSDVFNDMAAALPVK